MRDLDAQQGEHLADAVVQVAGEAVPLLLLNGEEARGELLHFGAGASDLRYFGSRFASEFARIKQIQPGQGESGHEAYAQQDENAAHAGLALGENGSQDVLSSFLSRIGYVAENAIARSA
jgi:hypothetical protein